MLLSFSTVQATAIRSVSALLGLNWPYRVIARQPIHYWESYGRSNRPGFYRRVSTWPIPPSSVASANINRVPVYWRNVASDQKDQSLRPTTNRQEALLFHSHDTLKDNLYNTQWKRRKMEIIIQLLINRLLNTKLTFIHTTVYECLYVKLSEITRRSPHSSKRASAELRCRCRNPGDCHLIR